MALSPIAKNTLAKVVEATQAGGFVHLKPGAAKPLETAGYIVGNPNLKDADGNVAYKATQTGVDQVSPAPQTTAPMTAPTPAPAPAPTAFANGEAESNKGKPLQVSEIKTGFVLPPIRRGRSAGASRYKFDEMEVGASFFVPADDDRPNPAKSLAGTVTSANKRFADDGKEFVVRSIEDGAFFGEEFAGRKGAVVARVK